MNCNTPTDIVFSFTGFATRGGQAGHRVNGGGGRQGQSRASTGRTAEARERDFMGVLSYARPFAG